MKNISSHTRGGRVVAVNGNDFLEAGAHTGVWAGFMPHKEGCKISAVTIVNKKGEELDTDPTWVNSVLDLDSYISAGLVNGEEGFITSVTVASGAGTFTKDRIPQNI
jgi:hypothetical protein